MTCLGCLLHIPGAHSSAATCPLTSKITTNAVEAPRRVYDATCSNVPRTAGPGAPFLFISFTT